MNEKLSVMDGDTMPKRFHSKNDDNLDESVGMLQQFLVDPPSFSTTILNKADMTTSERSKRSREVVESKNDFIPFFLPYLDRVKIDNNFNTFLINLKSVLMPEEILDVEQRIELFHIRDKEYESGRVEELRDQIYSRHKNVKPIVNPKRDNQELRNKIRLLNLSSNSGRYILYNKKTGEIEQKKIIQKPDLTDNLIFLWSDIYDQGSSMVMSLSLGKSYKYHAEFKNEIAMMSSETTVDTGSDQTSVNCMSFALLDQPKVQKKMANGDLVEWCVGFCDVMIKGVQSENIFCICGPINLLGLDYIERKRVNMEFGRMEISDVAEMT